MNKIVPFLLTAPLQEIQLPVSGKFLCIKEDRLWFNIDPEAPTVTVRIAVLPPNAEVRDTYIFLGTITSQTPRFGFAFRFVFLVPGTEKIDA